MSDHSWDDHDDDEHLAEPESSLDYFATEGGEDADPDDSGLDHLVTSDDETYDNETAGSYADAMEPETGGASDDDETPDDAPRVVVFAVSDPAGNVTAEASIAGSIQRIKLAPKAASMPETELARSILATAKLANMKGRAVQRALIEGVLAAEGLDDERVEAIIETNAPDLPTPQQADDAVAEAQAAYLRGEHR